MRVLVNTDVFCKLALGEMLSDALAELGTNVGECGRLPALPHMLRRGRLIRMYGPEACATLVPVANSMNPIPVPEATWLNRLLPVQAIDPGEALLFATAAQNALILMTGDRRALLALKDVDGYAEALAGQIIVLEAMLLALCDRLSPDEVRRRLGPLTTTDTTLRICFSAENSNPRAALESYYRSLAIEVRPLLLWEPPVGGPQ